MRLIKFRSCLQKVHAATPLQLVLFEEVRFAKYVDAHAIGNQLVGTLKTFCIDNGIEYTAIPVATIKKLATGKGNANKQAMLVAAGRMWPGYAFVDDNEADARHLMRAGLKELGIELAVAQETAC